MLVCSGCGKRLKKDEPIYQVRVGHLDEVYEEVGEVFEEKEDFIPDEDVAYYCYDCLPKEI